MKLGEKNKKGVLQQKLLIFTSNPLSIPGQALTILFRKLSSSGESPHIQILVMGMGALEMGMGVLVMEMGALEMGTNALVMGMGALEMETDTLVMGMGALEMEKDALVMGMGVLEVGMGALEMGTDAPHISSQVLCCTVDLKVHQFIRCSCI